MQNEQKVNFIQRWKEAQPTKIVLFWSVVVAIIVTMVAGFTWGGWVTASTARQQAERTATEAVVERLALICVDQFNQDPARTQKLVELNEALSYQRDDYVREQGWATISGEEKPDQKISEACANLIAQINP